MKSIQTMIKRVGQLLALVTAECYHYTRPADITNKYIVWQEDGEDDSFSSGNRKSEQQIHGTIDYFTQDEYDPAVDEIQEALNAAEIGFRIDSVQYEDDTKLIHYAWEFWVS